MITYKPSYPILVAWVVLFCLAISLRLAFAYYDPFIQGDWGMYSRVAANILSGCGVSASDPQSGACVPHFGGNGLPGYPAFIAIIWSIFGRNGQEMLVVPALIQCAALGWTCYAIWRYTGSRVVSIALGVVLAVSPPTISFARWQSTEFLAVAATMWVFAEIMLSLAEGRLRILSIGIALLVAVFIRLDSIALVVPVAVAAFWLHTPRTAVIRGGAIALILATPILCWFARNAVVGLPSITPYVVPMPDGTAGPAGYRRWVMTWVVAEPQRDHVFNRIGAREYVRIQVDDIERFGTAVPEVMPLMAELQAAEGKPFPADLDRRFAEIANRQIAEDPWRWWFVNPAERAFFLWWRFVSPLSSFSGDKPIELEFQQRVSQDPLMGFLGFAADHPGPTLMRLTTSVYRTVLISGAVVLLCLSILRRRVDPIVWIAISFFVCRTLLLVETFSLESRYMVEMVPVFEITVLLMIFRNITARATATDRPTCDQRLGVAG